MTNMHNYEPMYIYSKILHIPFIPSIFENVGFSCLVLSSSLFTLLSSNNLKIEFKKSHTFPYSYYNSTPYQLGMEVENTQNRSHYVTF